MENCKIKKLISKVLLIGLIGTVLLYCTKKKSDNDSALGAALFGLASIVPETGPGCDRTKKNCLISLLAGKTWYMVGSSQQPPNLLGFQKAVIDAFTCYHKTRAIVQTGSGGNDLSFTVANVNGTVSGSYPTANCDKDTPSGTYGADTSSTANTITPVSAECFDIDITYGTIIQVGRGQVNSDGTIFKLEVYRKDNADPEGHRCADGAVGEKNATLTPDSTSCNMANYVCAPAGDPNYNNVQTYDLTE